MTGPSPGGKRTARIEIIPFIDVVFFLLATFILYTLSLNKSAGVPVALPQVEEPEARDPANSVTISVTAEGTLAWDKDFINLDEFINRLRTYRQTNPEGRILINGDENATYNQVIAYVMDEVRKAGFQRVFIETRIRQGS